MNYFGTDANKKFISYRKCKSARKLGIVVDFAPERKEESDDGMRNLKGSKKKYKYE